MIDKYIEENSREKLLELAFNIEEKSEFDKIFDYFIKENNHYYLGELLSICQDFVSKNEAIKIINTKNQEFVFYILHYGPILDILNPVFFDTLEKYLSESE